MSPAIPTTRAKIRNRNKEASVRADLQTQYTLLSDSAPTLSAARRSNIAQYKRQKSLETRSRQTHPHHLTHAIHSQCQYWVCVAQSPAATCCIMLQDCMQVARDTEQGAHRIWLGAMCALGAPRAPLSFTLLLSGPLARARTAALGVPQEAARHESGLTALLIGQALRVSARQSSSRPLKSSGRHACHAAQRLHVQSYSINILDSAAGKGGT